MTVVPLIHPFAMKKSGFSSHPRFGNRVNVVGDPKRILVAAAREVGPCLRIAPSQVSAGPTASLPAGAYQSPLLRALLWALLINTGVKGTNSSDGDSLCITLRAPSSPQTPLAYKNGRPSPTARAPRQRAFNTSVPRRIPPSMNTWKSSCSNRSGLRSRSSWRIVIGAGELSTSEWKLMMWGNGLTSLVVCHHGLRVRFLEHRIRTLSLRPGKHY
jgi:hypothetical protein